MIVDTRQPTDGYVVIAENTVMKKCSVIISRQSHFKKSTKVGETSQTSCTVRINFSQISLIDYVHYAMNILENEQLYSFPSKRKSCWNALILLIGTI